MGGTVNPHTAFHPNPSWTMFYAYRCNFVVYRKANLFKKKRKGLPKKVFFRYNTTSLTFSLSALYSVQLFPSISKDAFLSSWSPHLECGQSREKGKHLWKQMGERKDVDLSNHFPLQRPFQASKWSDGIRVALLPLIIIYLKNKNLQNVTLVLDYQILQSISWKFHNLL